MSSKIAIEDIASALQAAQVEPAKQRVIMEALLHKVEEAKEERTAEAAADGPKPKYEYVIVVTDPDGRLNGAALVGFVAQMEQGTPAPAIVDRIRLAAGLYSRHSRKGKQQNARTVGEVFELPRRFWIDDKTHTRTLIKTKTPASVVVMPNAL